MRRTTMVRLRNFDNHMLGRRGRLRGRQGLRPLGYRGDWSPDARKDQVRRQGSVIASAEFQGTTKVYSGQPETEKSHAESRAG